MNIDTLCTALAVLGKRRGYRDEDVAGIVGFCSSLLGEKPSYSLSKMSKSNLPRYTRVEAAEMRSRLVTEYRKLNRGLSDTQAHVALMENESGGGIIGDLEFYSQDTGPTNYMQKWLKESEEAGPSWEELDVRGRLEKTMDRDVANIVKKNACSAAEGWEEYLKTDRGRNLYEASCMPGAIGNRDGETFVKALREGGLHARATVVSKSLGVI